MIQKYPVTPEFSLPRPLREDDQAVIDAMQQIKPGERGDLGYDFLERQAQVPRCGGGNFGELVIAGAINEDGKQQFAVVDILPMGVLVGIQVREPGSRKSSGKWRSAFSSDLQAGSARARAVKFEAADILRSAHEALQAA